MREGREMGVRETRFGGIGSRYVIEIIGRTPSRAKTLAEGAGGDLKTKGTRGGRGFGVEAEWF
jgi:hypothetical protein